MSFLIRLELLRLFLTGSKNSSVRCVLRPVQPVPGLTVRLVQPVQPFVQVRGPWFMGEEKGVAGGMFIAHLFWKVNPRP